MKKQIWMIFLFLLIGISVIGIATVSAEKTKNSTTDTTPAVTILKEANWVHGTDFNVEIPSRIYRTDRKGWGTEYWGTQSLGNWFHIAIPTTVISDGKRNSLAKTFVLYRTTAGAKITNVHIYDGPFKIKEYNGLNLNGNHGYGIDSSNTFVIDPPKQIFWGLGISVRVQFGDPDTAGGSILFTTAGADFYQ